MSDALKVFLPVIIFVISMGIGYLGATIYYKIKDKKKK